MNTFIAPYSAHMNTFIAPINTLFVKVFVLCYYGLTYFKKAATMSELVVKDNALIQASYTLDLAEQRLILLAIIEARNSGQGITHDSLLKIHASSYAEQFGVNDKTAYTVVKDASKGLFDRYVTYHDKNPKNGKDRSFNCRWVDKIGVEPDSGLCRFLDFYHGR